MTSPASPEDDAERPQMGEILCPSVYDRIAAVMRDARVADAPTHD
jgi:hypothetical protein